jgi:hypothetical protein
MFRKYVPIPEAFSIRQSMDMEFFTDMARFSGTDYYVTFFEEKVILSLSRKGTRHARKEMAYKLPVQIMYNC